MTKDWQDEATTFNKRSPAGTDYVYCWVDGIHLKVRLEQPGAKKALAEIWNAEDKDHAQASANVFAADYGTKWPTAATKITDDLDVLLAFY